MAHSPKEAKVGGLTQVQGQPGLDICHETIPENQKV